MRISGNVVVTGANRGLGLALVKVFANVHQVDRVFAACRKPEEAHELKKLRESCPKVRIMTMDVQKDLSVQLAVKEIEHEIQAEGISLLVNNAGILENVGSDFAQPNRSSFWRHFDVNSIGPVIVTRLLLPLLRRGAQKNDYSVVVNISSSVGSVSRIQGQDVLSTGNIIYGMSKAALNHFTASLASIEKSNGIVCVSLSPSWTRTRIGGQTAPSSPDQSARKMATVISNLKPEDSGYSLDCLGNQIPY